MGGGTAAILDEGPRVRESGLMVWEGWSSGGISVIARFQLILMRERLGASIL